MTEKTFPELRKFVVPEFVFGADARLLVGRYAKNFGARKVLVVSDPGVIQAGWSAEALASLEEEGLAFTTFSSVRSNPRDEEIMAGAWLYMSEGCNVIVAVGGGSAMDCAKGIGIVSSNGGHILDYEGVDQVPVPGPPLICIPTTAGSSADVSQFAIINDFERKVKIAIVSKTVVPDVALIDPITTLTLDVKLTAHTGMDALSHAIEAIASNASSPITDLHALEAVRLLSGNLKNVLSDPSNLTFRSNMMLGSLHAGIAFSNASLGAVHAMSHSLGGLLDLPHGQCNAMLLPCVMEFNFEVVPQAYYRVGEAMGLHLAGMPESQQKKAVLDAIKNLQRDAGIFETFGQMGMSRNDIPGLAENALQDACMVTNPRKPDRKDIEALYEKAF